MVDPEEPAWLGRLRRAAKQRPRTQFVKVRWHDLEQLLRERDYLDHGADDETHAALLSIQHKK